MQAAVVTEICVRKEHMQASVVTEICIRKEHTQAVGKACLYARKRCAQAAVAKLGAVQHLWQQPGKMMERMGLFSSSTLPFPLPAAYIYYVDDIAARSGAANGTPTSCWMEWLSPSTLPY
eukprot:1156061-Pelagomonas_calceolata.AAC.6